MKKLKWEWLDTLLLVLGLLPAGVALLLYDRLPNQMATHISASNNVDEYMSKPAAILLWVCLGILVPLVTKFSRKLDPERAQFSKFEGTHTTARVAVTILISVAGLFLLARNLGHDWSPRWLLSLGFGGLLVLLGNGLGRIRHNYTFGLRTPWTIANEEVWRRTHRQAGPVWVISGIVMMASTAFSNVVGMTLWFLALAVALGWPMLYSYILFTRGGKSL